MNNIWSLGIQKVENGYVVTWVDEENSSHSLLFEEQINLLKELPTKEHVINMLRTVLEFFAEEDGETPSYKIEYKDEGYEDN